MPKFRGSIRDDFPLRLLINGEDVTFEVDEGFTFSSTHPGGFEAASFPIPHDKPQIDRGDHVLLTCGLSVAWEGRVKEVQRSLGAKTLIQCEGYKTLLNEHTFSEVFVDRELSRWQGPPLGRQQGLLENAYREEAGQVSYDPVAQVPAILQSTKAPVVLPPTPTIENWYFANGIPIGSLYAAYSVGANMTAESTWYPAMYIATEPSWGMGSRNEENFVSKASGTFTLTSTGGSKTYAVLQIVRSAEIKGEAEYAFLWKNVAVYGKHGLTKRGGEPGGFYPSDVAQWAMEKCPGVQVGFVTASTEIVPHLVYLQPVPYEKLLDDMAKYAGYHWGVWESATALTGSAEPRVDFLPVPLVTAPTLYAWRKQCQGLDVRESIDNQYDTAVVTYTEPGGEERSVEVSYENETLRTENGEGNEVHRQLVLGLGTGTKAAAEAYGMTQLKLLGDEALMTGSVTIVEPIQEAGGGPTPAWLARPGQDRLRIIDLPSADLWGQRNNLLITRMECSAGSDGISTSLEYGIGVNLIETLTARLEAQVKAAA